MSYCTKRATHLAWIVVVALGLSGGGALWFGSALGQPPTNHEAPVFEIGERQISVSEMHSYLLQLVEEGALRASDREARKRAATRLLDRTVLLTEARRQQLEQREDAVRALEEAAVQQLLQQTYEAAVSDGKTEAEMRKRFEAHAARFAMPELRRAHFIKVATEEEARELIETLQGHGLGAFQKAAREKSLDQETKLRGGDLRYFDPQGNVYVWDEGGLVETQRTAKIVEALATATFTIAERGQLLPQPLPLEGGFGLLILSGKREARVGTYEAASASLRQDVLRSIHREQYDQLLERLRSQHQPRTYPEKIGPIRL